jgi:hypothetical protein
MFRTSWSANERNLIDAKFCPDHRLSTRVDICWAATVVTREGIATLGSGRTSSAHIFRAWARPALYAFGRSRSCGGRPRRRKCHERQKPLPAQYE